MSSSSFPSWKDLLAAISVTPKSFRHVRRKPRSLWKQPRICVPLRAPRLSELRPLFVGGANGHVGQRRRHHWQSSHLLLGGSRKRTWAFKQPIWPTAQDGRLGTRWRRKQWRRCGRLRRECHGMRDKMMAMRVRLEGLRDFWKVFLGEWRRVLRHQRRRRRRHLRQPSHL